jgi:hypothetical protein
MKLRDYNSSIDEIIDFSLSFNGYHYINGGPEKLADLWDKVIPLLNSGSLDQVSLEDIRACLFWLQRADRWTGSEYDKDEYIWFIEKIRIKMGL